MTHSHDDTLTINIGDLYIQAEAEQCDFTQLLMSQLRTLGTKDQLEALDSVAMALYQDGCFDLAEQIWQQGITLLEESQQKDAYLQYFYGFYINLATALSATSQYQQVIDKLIALLDGKTAERLQQEGLLEYFTEIHLHLANAWCETHQQTEAKRHADLAMQCAQTLQTYFHVCKACRMQGIYHHSFDDYEQAVGAYNHALAYAIEGNIEDTVVANLLMNIGSCEQHLFHFEQALESFVKAQDIYVENDSEEIYTLYINMGILLSKMHRFDEAESCLQAALEHYTVQGLDHDIATCCTNLGRLAEMRGQLPVALKWHQQGLDTLLKPQFHPTASITHLLNIANTLLQMDEHHQALCHYKRCLAVAKSWQLTDYKALAAKGLADLYTRRGRTQLAMARYQQSFELAQQVNDVELQIGCLVNLSTIENETGQLPQAISSLERAIELARQHQLVSLQISAEINLANLYIAMKDVNRALQLLLDARATVIDFEDTTLLSKVCSNLANLYELLDEDIIALGYAVEAHRLKQKQSSDSARLFSFALMARLSEKARRIHKAALYYQKALALQQTLPDSQFHREIQVNYALFIWHEKQDVRGAIALLQDALTFFKQNYIRYGEFAARASLGQIYAQDPQKHCLAVEYLIKAITCHNNIQVPCSQESWQIGYREDLEGLYGLLIRLTTESAIAPGLQNATPSQTWHYISEAKSWVFLNRINRRVKKTGWQVQKKHGLFKALQDCL